MRIHLGEYRIDFPAFQRPSLATQFHLSWEHFEEEGFAFAAVHFFGYRINVFYDKGETS